MAKSLSSVVALYLPFFLAVSTMAADRQIPPHLSDPFLDPANDPFNPLAYICSDTLTAISVALVMVVALVQTYFIFRRGAKWMMVMTLGAYLFAIGLSLRFGLARDPRSRTMYIPQYLFIVLAPCAFIAAVYMLLGRLTLALDADKHLLVSAKKITLIFVTSDVITFLTQAVGGSISSAADDFSTIMVGSRVFLGGLSAQLLSFTFFSAIYGVFLYRVYKHDQQIWTRDDHKPWYNNWKALAGALALSSVCLLIRSAFRVAELSEGYKGPLVKSEPLFYGLDIFPLIVAIGVYVPFWPGRFIPDLPPKIKTKTADSGESGQHTTEEYIPLESRRSNQT